jgi:DNA-binding NarL/FixJ family response regulator
VRVGSQPSSQPRGALGDLRLVVSAADPNIRDRIVATLAPIEPPAPPRDDGDGALSERDVAADAIVVLYCDVDSARQMTGLRRLRREMRAAMILIVSPPANGRGVRRALDAGADAVVFEPELEQTLTAAVGAVACGQSVVPRSVRASIERPALSHRERQVLACVSHGITNAQIADRLFLAESTVKSHLSSAFSKLGVRSRREAAAHFRDLERTA